MPVALGLVLLLLLNFDPRFPDEWSFRPRIIIIGALAFLAVRGLHFITGLRPKWNLFKDRQEFIPRPAIPYLVLAIVMGLGLALRLHGLGYISFDHDEMGLITKSHGIYHLGFPYTMFAGEVRPLTTYEAVPYPLALSGLIFGYSEWSMRLPACLFGTLTIGVIALFGRRLFNWRTGLATAFIYACIPLNIRWAQNSFYPQQCQFFAMFTCWMFYEAIRVKPLHRRFLTVASISFCVTYLSWEGTAFLLPALFLGLMVIRWGKWWWLKEFHLYRCLFFIGAVVVAEYCSRTLAGFPYLQIGSGLSNLTGPSLFFLTAAYQPMFYIDKLWLSENHVFFTVMALVGLPFCWRERGFRYVFVLLVTLWFLHTNFLAALSPRYCYYYQPLLVLSGTAAAVGLYDRFLALLKEESVMGRAAAHLSGGLALLLLFLQSNESVLREYHLSSLGDAPGLMTRMYTYRYDYRGAAKFVKERAQPGDVIFPGIPHVFAYYAGIPGDYFLNTLLASKVPYNQTLSEPRFVDKFAGLPVVRNLAELREVVNRGRRTWIIFAPYASFERLTNPNVLEYLDQNAKVVYESYRVKVLLVEGRKGSASLVQSP